MGESSYVVNAKPGKNNFIFIAGRFDPGHWEFWVNFMHFLVAAQSWPARASCSSSGRAERPWGQAAWGVTEGSTVMRKVRQKELWHHAAYNPMGKLWERR